MDKECQYYIWVKTQILLNNNNAAFFCLLEKLATKGNPYAILDLYNNYDHNKLFDVDFAQIQNNSEITNMTLAIKNFLTDSSIVSLKYQYENLQNKAEEISIMSCMLKKEQIEKFNYFAQELDIIRKEIYLNDSYINLKKQILNYYKEFTKGSSHSLVFYNYGIYILYRMFYCLPNATKLKKEYKQNTHIIYNNIKYRLSTKQPVSDYEILIYAEYLLISKNRKKQNVAKHMLQCLANKYHNLDSYICKDICNMSL